MRREELAVLKLAAERMPASAAIRAALNSALWAAGRIDAGAPKAEWIANRNPASSESAWHAGYARMLLGEDRRPGEDPDGPIREYEKASSSFRLCSDPKLQYKESTDLQA